MSGADADRRRTFHALLVGIDAYTDNSLPSGASYRPLEGCVHDVNAVEAMLLQRIDDRVLQRSIRKLTASNRGNGPPPEPKSAWPTAENIRRELKALAEYARPGDQVLFFYAGHGGRVRTEHRELKGDDAYDEALVPYDIGGGDGTVPERYIRDVELATFVKRLTARVAARATGDERAHLTFIFDSCHSGGTMRDDDSAPRCATPGTATFEGAESRVDTRRSGHRSAADEAELAAQDAAWREAAGSVHGGAEAVTPWLPNPKDYVLLAACGDNEAAFENKVGAAGRQGALTEAFLYAAALGSPPAWWVGMEERIVARVQRPPAVQTPHVFGDRERELFGTRRRAIAATVPVLQVTGSSRRVRVAVGVAAAIVEGTELAIYKAGTVDFTDESRVATGHVTDVGAVGAWVDIAAGADMGAIKEAQPAVILSLPREHRVSLMPRTKTGVSAAIYARQADALAAALGRHGRGFVAATATGETPDYQVALDGAGRYEILDSQGGAFPGMTPLVAVDAAGAEELVALLRRLAKYDTVLALSDGGSALAHSITITLERAGHDWKPGDSMPDSGEALPATGGQYVVPTGAYLFFRVANRSQSTIHFAVLDLQSDWEILQAVPPRSCGTSQEIAADHSAIFPLRMTVSKSSPGKQTLDVLRAFACVDEIDLDWLVQPGVGEMVGDPTRTQLKHPIAQPNDSRAAPATRARDDQWLVQTFRVLVRP